MEITYGSRRLKTAQVVFIVFKGKNWNNYVKHTKKIILKFSDE